MIAGGGFAFAAVAALMRALDRFPARKAKKDVIAVEPEFPRLRRADFHPDAPSRRPLMARQDLGDPVEDAEFEDAPEPAADPQPEPPVAEASPEEPVAAALAPEEPAVAEAAPEEPVAVEEPVAPPAQPEAEAEPLELTEALLETPPARARKTPALPPIVQAVEPLPAAEPQPVREDDASLTRLMRRLEKGMNRREQTLSQPPAPAEEPPVQGEENAGHRLRSAISDLQKLAGRGG
jgi:hypothetical protein